MATQVDFDFVLERYKKNLTDLKVSGNTALRTAVDTDKAWLDAYINYLNGKSEQQQGYIQRFVANYEQANPELVQMQQEMKKIQEDGPKLQDIYETEKKAQEEEPIDYTPYYVKAGLIVGVGALVAVVSAFRPVYTM